MEMTQEQLTTGLFVLLIVVLCIEAYLGKTSSIQSGSILELLLNNITLKKKPTQVEQPKEKTDE